MAKKQTCPSCGRTVRLTRHHVLPKHVFGQNDSRFDLCRLCHNELEEVIRGMEKYILQNYENSYAFITEQFVKDKRKGQPHGT